MASAFGFIARKFPRGLSQRDNVPAQADKAPPVPVVGHQFFALRVGQAMAIHDRAVHQVAGANGNSRRIIQAAFPARKIYLTTCRLLPTVR